MSRKYIGHAGQIAIVFVSLYLLYIVGMDFYLYDVEYSGGSDDARWTIPNEGWDDGNTIRLLWWGFYLFVTGTHLFLYFKRLSSMKKFNVWALPWRENEGNAKIEDCMNATLISLWLECQCHPNTNLGYPDSKSPSYDHTKTHQTHLEFLGIGLHDKNRAHVLCELLHFP